MNDHLTPNQTIVAAAPLSLHETFPSTDAAQVLLVHEHRASLGSLRVALRQEGYSVKEIGWVADLFDYLREPLCASGPIDLPDLIIVDLDALTGSGALRVLADLHDAGPRTRLIFLASWPDPELRRQVDQLRSAYLLDKPCTVDEVRYLTLSLIRPN
jgi:DNA-binding response OmpR family regulator